MEYILTMLLTAQQIDFNDHNAPVSDLEWAKQNPNKTLGELIDYHRAYFKINLNFPFNHDLLHYIVGKSQALSPIEHQDNDTSEIIVDSIEDVLLHFYQENTSLFNPQLAYNLMSNHLNLVRFTASMQDVDIEHAIDKLLPYVQFLMEFVEKNAHGQERTGDKLGLIIDQLRDYTIVFIPDLNVETKPVAVVKTSPISRQRQRRYA